MVGVERVVIHSDLRAAIQALHHCHPMDNITLTSWAHSLQKKQCYRLPNNHQLGPELRWHTWKRGCRRSSQTCHVAPRTHLPLSLSTIRATLCCTVHYSITMELDQWTVQGTHGTCWYAETTECSTPPPPPATDYCLMMAIHHLCLGYCCIKHVDSNQQERECQACGDTTKEPLLHYLLECPVTAGNLAHKREHTALGLVAATPTHQLLALA